MLLATLEYGNEELLRHLFDDCGVVDWLINAPKSIPRQPRGGYTQPEAHDAGNFSLVPDTSLWLQSGLCTPGWAVHSRVDFALSMHSVLQAESKIWHRSASLLM